MPRLSEYGSNPNAGVDSNADHGWGGYQWPGGVPGSLLGTARYKGASCTCRRELVELFQLCWEIADKVHGYTVYGNPNPSGEPTWGPWGYENRPIGGTSSASNHSRGRAMDVNAPRNPQTYAFESDMPPAMVRCWESLGFYWGGRYGGGTKYDAMHFEYIGTPGDVAGHVAQARNILIGAGAGSGIGTIGDVVKAPEQLEEDELMGAKDDILAEMKASEKRQNDRIDAAVQAINARVDQRTKDGSGSLIYGKYSQNDVIAAIARGQKVNRPEPAAPPAPAGTVYVVKESDSDGFNAIAKRLGVTPDALAKANPAVKDIDNIAVGDKLNVPK